MKAKLIKAVFAIAIAGLIASGCKKSDGASPEITLAGDMNMTVYKGQTYTDPGYTATDDKDGDITSKVSVSGTVGTEIGNYTITYSVSDEAGNFTSKYRYVAVKYGNTYLAGTYTVTETSPFGSNTYGASVTASTSNSSDFVFGSLSAPDPIVVSASIGSSTGINFVSAAQGGPVTNYSGSISETSGVVKLTMSYLRPINGTTTNCNATWTKQ
jgi:hypothetical protein